jgi:Iap family predicted aminopeptidase
VNLLETLGVEIGPRTAGSPAAQRAAEAIAAAFRELGLEPRFEDFTLLGYEAEEPVLTIDGARWPAGPCQYAHPTPDGGVTGTLRRFGEQESLPGFPPTGIWAIEDDDGNAQAFVYENPVRGGAIPFVNDGPVITTPPIAFISTDDAKRVPEGASASLEVRGTFVPGRRERNVIAELPGRSEETIVVGAHYDSVWHGPGVIDNASGVEGVRRIAERFVGKQHERTLVFVAFASEEIGLIGSQHLVREWKVRGRLKSVVGCVNLDCIAHGDKLELMVGPDELRGRALEATRRLGLDKKYELTVTEPGGGTDHYYFAQEKIPAVSILHFPYPEYHLPNERLELVDEQKLSDAVDLAVDLVESQLARPVPKPA